MENAKEIAEQIAAATGWKPPIMYDVAVDDYRLVTQADVDRFMAVNRTYGKMVEFLKREHAALIAEVQPK